MPTARSEYKAAHKRVTSVKGPVSHKPCEFCGIFADDYAYNHQDPEEIYREGYLWSESTVYYFPACRRHHRAYDQAFRKYGKSALPAVAEALREAAREHYEERRAVVEAAADASWRARENALAARRTVPTVADPVASKAAQELMQRAYSRGPSRISPEELRASWVRWSGDR
ncbi:hypothetical protein [Streptomyces sp. NPDC006855]|uniref:hypothetical protein n=1 Tax=Streptomyces sp. NPDC006855 TaxID=3364765 RepID=UPI00369C795A